MKLYIERHVKSSMAKYVWKLRVIPTDAILDVLHEGTTVNDGVPVPNGRINSLRYALTDQVISK